MISSWLALWDDVARLCGRRVSVHVHTIKMAALGLLFNSGGPIIRRDPWRPAVSVGMQLGLGTGLRVRRRSSAPGERAEADWH